VASLGLQLEATSQLAQRNQATRQVAAGHRADRQVVLDRNLDGLLKVGDAAEITAKESGGANGLERPNPIPMQPEAVGHLQRLPPDLDRVLDRLGSLGPKHEVLGEAGECMGLGG
jgi:hypothetical protein